MTEKFAQELSKQPNCRNTLSTIRQPDSPRSNKLLKILHDHSSVELYPGVREDLENIKL